MFIDAKAVLESPKMSKLFALTANLCPALAYQAAANRELEFAFLDFIEKYCKDAKIDPSFRTVNIKV